MTKFKSTQLQLRRAFTKFFRELLFPKESGGEKSLLIKLHRCSGSSGCSASSLLMLKNQVFRLHKPRTVTVSHRRYSSGEMFG